MPPSRPLTPRSHRRSVHSVRSVHRRSVTFAAESLTSSAASTDKDQLSASTGARESIVPENDDPDTDATAGHTPRPSKRASLLRSSFNASRRTLNRLRRSRSSVPITVTEEFTVERIVHPDEHDHAASSDWGTHVESQSATTPPDSPSTLRAKRKAFARLARAAFGTPSRNSSVSTRARKHRSSSHAVTPIVNAPEPAPEPDPAPEPEPENANGQAVPIEVFIHGPSPPPATPPELPPLTPFAEPATPAVTETTVAPATTATDTSAPTPAVAHESLPSTAVSSPNPKKPKFRAKLNRLWTEQARVARDTLRSASRFHLQSRSRSSPPTPYAPPSADSALFPLPPESPVSPVSPAASRSQSRLRRIASRLSSVRNKSKSTVHLDRIPEIVTADGHVLVNPAALADSPLSQHSDLPPESPARQSWWTPSHYSQSHSRFPSAVTLPDEQSYSYSRPVSEALFPSTPYPHARKPKLSIVTDPVSKAGEPQPKTPKSILKSPSRAFFRRRSSPLPHAAPPAPESKPAPNFFSRAFSRSQSQPKLDLEPQPQFDFDSVLHSTELFPLPTPSTSTSPAPAYRPPSPPALSSPAPSASAHAHEFFFPSEKPQQLAVTDAEGNAVWYIEKEASSLAAPIPIPFIPPHKDPHRHDADTNDTNDTMGAKDWRDDGIDYAEDEDDFPPGFQWFSDRPPKPDPPPPRTTSTVYQPLPSVIDENERMLKALNQAPSVLYQRYHEFGQLGVFGWTSEFAELIDALKTLGFDGNMFVSTRQAALDACSRILSLRIEIKMQIITIYLTNQISRLRRFLDADKQWNDYPPVDFPTDPYAAEAG